MIIIQSLIIGILSGIISAFLFYWMLKLKKPKVKISPKICTFNRVSDGQQVFASKFINYSRSNIENISIKAFLYTETFHGNNGKNYQLRPLKLVTSQYDLIRGKKEKRREIHNNCIWIIFNENLNEIWTKGVSSLQVQITSYHSGSGSRSVITKDYGDPHSCLEKGEFDSGETFDIIRKVN